MVGFFMVMFMPWDQIKSPQKKTHTQKKTKIQVITSLTSPIASPQVCASLHWAGRNPYLVPFQDRLLCSFEVRTLGRTQWDRFMAFKKGVEPN